MNSAQALAGGLVLLASLAMGGGAGAAAEKPGVFIIVGLVTDTSGMPVGHLPIRVSASRRPLQADPRLGLNDRKLIVSAISASDGTFRVAVPVQPGKMKYYLSFYVRGLFDEVRYARPDRINITSKVKSGKTILFEHRLPFHGSWVKVQETLKAYPKNSLKARILRRYGIAEEIRKDGEEAEVWWYYSRGKRFDFKGDKVVAEKNFSPVIK